MKNQVNQATTEDFVANPSEKPFAQMKKTKLPTKNSTINIKRNLRERPNTPKTHYLTKISKPLQEGDEIDMERVDTYRNQFSTSRLR